MSKTKDSVTHKINKPRTCKCGSNSYSLIRVVEQIFSLNFDEDHQVGSCNDQFETGREYLECSDCGHKKRPSYGEKIVFKMLMGN